MSGPREVEGLPVRASMTPFRVSALCIAGCVVAIVWMGYHYTGALVAQALTLLAEEATLKDGVIQLMTAVVGNMVAMTAVAGLIGGFTKLCEN